MSITDKLLSDIQEDINADAMGRTAVKPEKLAKVEAQPTKAGPLKRATAAGHAIFKKMCVSHEAIRLGIKKLEVEKTVLNEKIKERQGRLSEVKTRIGEFCIDYGVTVQPKIDSTGKAFYNRPWKAQAEIKRNASTMAEPIRLWAVKKIGMIEMLFTPDPEAKQTLNITGMRKLLETEAKLDPALRTQLQGALNALVKLGQATDLVDSPEVTLNLEAYDEAKKNGLIPAKVLAEAEEGTSYIHAVSVDKIIDLTSERCVGCSDKLPKKREAKHACKRCGTEN